MQRIVDKSVRPGKQKRRVMQGSNLQKLRSAATTYVG
jgi:hypothetical protein